MREKVKWEMALFKRLPSRGDPGEEIRHKKYRRFVVGPVDIIPEAMKITVEGTVGSICRFKIGKLEQVKWIGINEYVEGSALLKNNIPIYAWLLGCVINLGDTIQFQNNPATTIYK